jgi:hypothetical protein
LKFALKILKMKSKWIHSIQTMSNNILISNPMEMLLCNIWWSSTVMQLAPRYKRNCN